MSEEIFFDGFRYIPASDAAEKAYLTRDYVARLCRDGKVTGRRVGKNWYVRPESLNAFLVEQEYQKTVRHEELRQERAQEYHFSVPVKGEAREEYTGKPAQQQKGDSIVQKMREALARKDLAPLSAAESQAFLHAPAGVSDALLRGAHIPAHAVTPMLDFLHKALALTLAMAITFGTYSLVDPMYAKQAAVAIRDSVNQGERAALALAEDAVSLAHGHIPASFGMSSGRSMFTASAADAVMGTLQAAARSFSAKVDGLIYAIAFPNFVTNSSAFTSAPTTQGIVSIRITPYVAPVQNATKNYPMTITTQNITQPVIEHVIEKQTLADAGGISEATLDARLQELDNKLTAKIYSVAAAAPTVSFSGLPYSTPATTQTVALSNVINDLRNVAYHGGTIDGAAISNSTFSGGSITNSSVQATSLSTSGDASLGGNLSVSGSISGLGTFSAVTASSTYLLATYATTTNATTTSLFATLGRFTQAIVDSFSATVGTITGLTATNATTTNATSTNLFATSLVASSASSTNLLFLNATGTSATTTNLYASNFFSAFASSTNIIFLNATGTAATTTSFFAQTASSTNLFATAFSAANGTTTGSFYVGNGLGIGVATTAAGVLQTSGNAWIGGNLHVGNGATIIGNSSADTLSVNSSITSNLVPDQNKVRDLGSAAFYWRTGYIDTVTANNLSAASSSVGGTNSQTFTINSANGTADTQNMQLIFFRGTVVPNALLSWNSAANAKRFEFNQPLYIQNGSASTTEQTLALQAVAGQTAAIFNIASSSGATLFSVGSDGLVSLTNLALSGSTTLQNFTFTNATGTSATTTNLAVTSIPSSLLKTNANGSVIPAIANTDYATPANVLAQYPFALTGNATSTLTQFNGGITALASSTIGNGTQAGGLTVSGTATSTNLAVTSITSALHFANSIGQITAYGGSSCTNQFVRSLNGAGVATCATVNLASDVTGTLPIANGGTGTTTAPSSQLLYGGGTGVYQSVATSSLTAGTALSFSGTAGSLVGGTNLTINFSAPLTSSLSIPYASSTALTATALFSTNATTTSFAALGPASFANSANFFGLTSFGGTATTSVSAAGALTTPSIIATNATSTSLFSVNLLSNTASFGATATSSFNSAGALSLASALGLSSGGTATTTFYNGGVVFSDGTKLTQAAAASSFFWDNTNNRLGVGTSTPWGLLSVNPNGISGPAFAIGSSTATNFVVTNGGNVGIGTASPGKKLDVAGDTRVYTGSETGTLYFGSAGTGYLDYNTTFTLSKALTVNAGITSNGSAGGLNVTKRSDSSPAWTLYSSSGDLQFYDAANATDRVTFKPSGNLGIGTTSPAQLLAVQGNALLSGNLSAANVTATGTITFSSLGTHMLLTSNGSGAVTASSTPTAANYLATSTTATTTLAGMLAVGSNALNVLSNGNVGIGTASPVSQLEIVAPAATEGTFVVGVTGITAKTAFGTNSGGGYVGQFFTGANESVEGTRYDTSKPGIGVTYDNRAAAQQINYNYVTAAGVLTYPFTFNMAQSPTFAMDSLGSFVWTNSPTAAYGTTFDTGISRTSAGLVEINNGTPGTLRDLYLRSATTTGQTVLARDGGNVGIGTTSPSTTFGLVGSQYLTGGLGAGVLNTTSGTIQSSGNMTAGGVLAVNGTSGTSTIASGQGFTIGTSQFVLQQGSGNVGIGTTSPGYLFVAGKDSGSGDQVLGQFVNANANGGTLLDIDRGADSSNVRSSGIQLKQNGVLEWFVGVPRRGGSNHSDRFTISTNQDINAGGGEFVITSSGLLGLGNISPTYKLDVIGLGHFTGLVDAANFVATSTSVASQIAYRLGINNSSPSYPLDVSGFINTDQYSGYKQAGNTILYASTTNNALAVGASSAAGWMSASSTAWNSIAIGQGALATTPTNGGARYNIALGDTTLASNTTGIRNIAIGYQNLNVNTTGGSNTAIGGYRAMVSNTTGGQNTAVGDQAISQNTTGSYNTGLGYNSLFFNSTGNYNTALGPNALFTATSTSNQTAIGYGALQNSATGVSNLAIGYNALNANTYGNYNVAIGESALSVGTSTAYATAVGYHALENFKTSQQTYTNTAFGSQALRSTTYGIVNAAFGDQSLLQNTTGSDNSAFGDRSLNANTTGTGNTGVGERALFNNQTGNYNTTLGIYAGYNITGSNNLVLGYGSGNGGITSGSYNILIGDDVRNGLTQTGSNQLNIGNLLFSNSIGTGATAATGNIGVGTSTPWGKLSVTGAGTGAGVNFLLADSNNSPIFKILDNGTATLTGGLTASALSAFNGGLTAYASSTIGAGGQTTGLTISGGATTTGNAYFAGNVGVGTTSPYRVFSVAGTVAFNSSSINLDNTTGSQFNYNLSGRTINEGVNSAGQFFINDATAGTGRLLINTDGRIGIGDYYSPSNLPQNKLSVAGNASIGFTTATDAAAPSNGLLVNGNVGIGTANPTAPLDVKANAGQDSIYFRDSAGTLVGYLGASSSGNGRLIMGANVGINNNGFTYFNGGNVGIGTTSPSTLLSLAGTTGLYASTTATSTFQGGGINLTTAAGNTGCYSINGTCLPTTSVLSSSIAAAYPFALTGNATSTLTQFNGGLTAYASSTIGAGGQTTGLTISGGATTTGNAYVAGNVGIGTTSPATTVAISGHCVTGDTRLRRRRRRVDGSYEYDEPEIVDLEEGDEIQSLDEKTGEMVWSRVRKVMFMGVRQTYRITTDDGREIRTTAEHPYLIRDARGKWLRHASPIAGAGWITVANLKEGDEIAIPVWTTAQNEITTLADGDSELRAPSKVRGTRLGSTSIRGRIWVSSKALSVDSWFSKAGEGSRTPGTQITKSDPIPDLRLEKSYHELLMKQALGWAKIRSIEPVAEEDVYDVEIEGTHNFVANGIVAHNTYLTGGLGVGLLNTTAGTADILTSVNVGANGSGYKQNGNTILYASSTLLNVLVGTAGANLNSNSGTNVAVGMSALATATSTQSETAIGASALANDRSVTGNNTAVGNQALYNNTYGYRNTAVGSGAMFANTTGVNNSAFGLQALNLNTTGGNNTAIGYSSFGKNTTGNSNAGLGIQSGYNNTTGGNNTALGYLAFFSATSSSNNTAVGYQAGNQISGATGAVGGNNTLLGYQAGYDITLGSHNLILGDFTTTGSGITTGSNNILLGQDLRTGFTNTSSNQLNIGNLIFGTGLGSGTTLGTGNVGIGTTSPSTTFGVVGSGYFTGGFGVGVLNTSAGTLQTSGNATIGGTVLGSGIVSAGTEFRLGNASFSRIATLDGGGGFGGGYNFDWNNGAPRHDSTGALTGIGYTNGGNLNFYTRGSQTAGTAAQLNMQLNTTGNLSINGTSGTTTIASGQGFTIGTSQFVLQQGSGSLLLGTTRNTDNLTTRHYAMVVVPASGHTGGLMVTNNQNLSGANALIGGNNYQATDGTYMLPTFGFNTNAPNSSASSLTGQQIGTVYSHIQPSAADLSLLNTNNSIYNLGNANTSGEYINYQAYMNTQSGTTTKYTGFKSIGTMSTNSSGATDWYDFNAAPITSIGAGSGRIVNNRYGLYIDFDNTGITTNAYGVYQSSNTLKNYFAGNLGIGTTSPAQLLAVQGNALLSGNLSAANVTATGTITFSSLGTHMLLTSNGSGAVTASSTPTAANYLATSTTATTTLAGMLAVGSNALNVLSNGNVGIGTAGPGSALDFGTSQANVRKIISLYHSGNRYSGIGQNSIDASPVIFGATDDAYDTIFGNLSSSDGTTFTTHAVITNAGKVGIGTTTPTWLLNPTSASAAQLALSAGAGVSQWAFRNAGGTFYLSTTTVAGTATSTASALTIDTNGIPTLPSLGGSTGCAQFDTTGKVSNTGTACGTGGGAFPFTTGTSFGSTVNSTSTILQLTAGLFASSTVRFGNAGVSPFFFDGSIGNLGLGTTSPGTLLSLQGIANFHTATSTFYSSGGINLSAGCFSVNGTCVGGGSGSGTVGSGSATNLPFYAANGTTLTATSTLTLALSGNFGVGSTTPSAKLSVQGSGTGTGKAFAITDSANTQRFVVNDNGQAGLGMDPDTLLTVAGSSASAIDLLHLRNTTGAADLVFRNEAGNGRYSLYSELNGTGNLLMTWNGDTGNVGIGTTTPWGQLSVNPNGIGSGIPALVIGSSTKTSFIVTGNNNSGFGTTSPWGKLSVDTSSMDTGTPSFVVGSSTRTDFLIAQSGNVGIGTTTPWVKLAITNTVSSAQLAVAYDATRYATLQMDSAGDLNLDAQGKDLLLTDDNLWACTTGCPAGNPTGTGNIVAENKVGIGTSTPAAKLTIETQDSTTDFLQIASSTAQNLLNFTAAGKLGIGTSTPWTKLSVGPNGAITTTEKSLTDGATITIDWSQGNQQVVTLGGNRAVTFSNYSAGQGLRLVMCQDGTGSRTVTSWPSVVLWSGGTAPTLTTTANKCDVISFIGTTGTSTLKVLGSAVLNF